MPPKGGDSIRAAPGSPTDPAIDQAKSLTVGENQDPPVVELQHHAIQQS